MSNRSFLARRGPLSCVSDVWEKSDFVVSFLVIRCLSSLFSIHVLFCIGISCSLGVSCAVVPSTRFGALQGVGPWCCAAGRRGWGAIIAINSSLKNISISLGHARAFCLRHAAVGHHSLLHSIRSSQRISSPPFSSRELSLCRSERRAMLPPLAYAQAVMDCSPFLEPQVKTRAGVCLRRLRSVSLDAACFWRMHRQSQRLESQERLITVCTA